MPSKPDTKPETKTPARAAAAEKPATATERAKPAAKPGECVVKSDRHVGAAVNGKVCSYHAVWYDRDGRRRT